MLFDKSLLVPRIYTVYQLAEFGGELITLRDQAEQYDGEVVLVWEAQVKLALRVEP
jgi:hypothetical protein